MALPETPRIPTRIVLPNDVINRMSEQVSTVSPQLGVSVSSGIFVPDETLPIKPEIMVDEGINKQELKMIQPFLFDSVPQVLQNTLNNIGQVQLKNLQGLTIEYLPTGGDTYIFMCKALVYGTSYSFFAQLAREPYKKGDVQARSSSNDVDQGYFNLLHLSQSFRRYAKAGTRERCDVSEPAAIGRAKLKGGEYALVTTPFLQYGTLEVNFLSQKGGGMKPMPFLQYGIPYNGALAATNLSQMRMAEKCVEDGQLGIQREGAGIGILRRQMDDFFRSEMVVHILAGERMPSGHSANEGDWMGIITPHGLRMKLVSIRGSLVPISKIDYIHHLLTKKERGMLDGREPIESEIAAGYTEARLLALYDEASKWVRTGEL